MPGHTLRQAEEAAKALLAYP
ncbi:protein of unknown function [Trichlorobacter ammonificans]|uniref:Uncharacterized protein n=1 Tax=Trichlorobacter ammonificans TaxID=2916410 RepID=A0ABM9DBD7_9BACT|nr:protein of unknown function [Trichlorobacter ammonificans]